MIRTAVLLFSIVALFLCSVPAQGAVPAETELSALSTGIEDQTGVAITIYNVNLGLVKDTRQIAVPKGTTNLRFMDVARADHPGKRAYQVPGECGELRVLEPEL